MPYIRFSSHRAREYGLRALDRRPLSYYSWKRKTGPGGVYELTEEEIAKLRGERLVRFTRLRGPYDDLLRCIDW